MEPDKKDQKCGFCKHGKETEEICGKLWHDELQKCAAHKKCMQYSALLAQYKMRRFGGFKVNKVIKEVQRGKRLKCAICIKDKKLKKIAGGATAGCAVKKCKKTFHYYCACKDKEARTKRIESTSTTGKPQVSYCVFCGEEHENEYLKGLKNVKVVKDTDSEEDENESYTESDDDRSDDDDNSPSGGSSDSESRTSSRGDKDGDRSNKSDMDSVQPQQQQQSTSGGKNGTVSQKVRSESHESSSQDSDRKLNIFKDQRNHLDISGYNALENEKSMTELDGDQTDKVEGFVKQNNTDTLAVGKRANDDDTETTVKRTKNEEILHISSENNGMEVEVDDTMFVVCFLEKRDLADSKTTHIIQKCANKVFNLPPDAIFLWQYNGRPLSPGHVIYLLNEISKALCLKNEEELHRLMFNVQDSDICKFDSAVNHNSSLSDEICEELYTNIRHQISENFDKAEQNYSQCVGKFCMIKQLSTYVGFVLLCHDTDSTGMARAHMHGEKPVYIWDRDTVLVAYGCHKIPNRGSLRLREFDKLHCFLKNIPVSRVHSWPKDAVLRLVDEFSVTGKLHEHCANTSTPTGAHLVFLGPVDRSIMHYGLYIPKRISMILDELLTAKHEVYCVLDVGPDIGLCSLKDVVPKLCPGIELEALIANDPKLMYASCAILHFSLSV